MPYYQSIHQGVLRVSLNEQYVWSWLAQNEKPKTLDVHQYTLLIEDEIHMHPFAKPLVLNEVINRTYYKHVTLKES